MKTTLKRHYASTWKAKPKRLTAQGRWVMWSPENAADLPAGMQNDTKTLENILAVP